MVTNTRIAVKRKTRRPFCHPVILAISVSFLTLTGCQTTTGVQSNTPSSVIPPNKPASAPDQTSHPSQQRSSPNNSVNHQAKPIYPSNQPPYSDPDSTTIIESAPPKTPKHIDDANMKADKAPASSSDSPESHDSQVTRKIEEEAVENYGVIFPTQSPTQSPIQSPTQSTAQSPAQSSSSHDTNVQPTTTVNSDNNQVPQSTTSISPDNNTASVTTDIETATAPAPAKPDTNQPISATAVIIKLPKPDPETVQQTLLNQARQHSTARPNTTAPMATGDDIPAFRQLMNAGVKQLRQGQLSAAQSTFTRAQRLAPQSSAVYFYLAQVALKQNQYLKAEAMARRGLVVAQTAPSKKSLWQVILISAQYQGNQRVIAEAQAALAH